MTYALAWPLQEALWRLLVETPEVAAHLGGRVHDAPPPLETEAAAEGVYALIGDEAVEDWSTSGDAGARHVVTIALVAPRHGFAAAKRAAGAVSDALLGGALAPNRGRAVNVRFVEGRTRRDDRIGLRRIDLRFAITMEDTL